MKQLHYTCDSLVTSVLAVFIRPSLSTIAIFRFTSAIDIYVNQGLIGSWDNGFVYVSGWHVWITKNYVYKQEISLLPNWRSVIFFIYFELGMVFEPNHRRRCKYFHNPKYRKGDLWNQWHFISLNFNSAQFEALREVMKGPWQSKSWWPVMFSYRKLYKENSPPRLKQVNSMFIVLQNESWI